MPAMRIFDGKTFAVDGDLDPEGFTVAEDSKPAWLDRLSGEFDEVDLSVKKGNHTAERMTSFGRFRLSFSRLAARELNGERYQPAGREDSIRFVIESLHSVLQDGPDRGALESIGGAVAPQINLNVEF